VSWYLEDVQDTLEDSTNAAGAVQVRDRRTVILYQVHKGPSFSTEVGTAKTSITWNVGTLTYIKSSPSGKRYVCMQDGLSEVQQPTKYTIRRQIWTYVSEWRDAPEFDA